MSQLVLEKLSSQSEAQEKPLKEMFKAKEELPCKTDPGVYYEFYRFEYRVRIIDEDTLNMTAIAAASKAFDFWRE